MDKYVRGKFKVVKGIVGFLAVLLFLTALIVSASPVGAGEAAEMQVTSFRMQSAEMRLKDYKSGIRFTAAVDKEEYDALAGQYDISVNTVIIPSNLFEGELTPETPGTLNVAVERGVEDADGETYLFRAVVSEIPQSAYCEEICARSFLVAKDKESGAVITVPTETVSSNAAYLSYYGNIINTGLTAAEKNIAKRFYEGVDFYSVRATDNVVCGYKYAFEGQLVTAYASSPGAGKRVTNVYVIGADGNSVVFDSESGKVQFVMPAKSVSFNVATGFYDPNIEPGVLMDFEESYYTDGVSTESDGIGTDNSRVFLYPNQEGYVPPDMQRLNMDHAVLWQTMDDDSAVLRFEFGRTVKTEDIGGIYIDMAPSYLVGFENGGGGIYARFRNSFNQVVYNVSLAHDHDFTNSLWEFNHVVIPAENLLEYGVKEFGHLELFCGKKEINVYISEIGIADKAG